MTTNKYLEKYMRLNNEKHEVEKALNKLCWEDKDWGIKIIPNHFSCFTLKVITEKDGGTLHVQKARDLAKWLLDVTDGLEDTFDITREIIKRRD